jgi:hypothetical protein
MTGGWRTLDALKRFAEPARLIQIEDLIGDGKMPSFEQVVVASCSRRFVSDFMATQPLPDKPTS